MIVYRQTCFTQFDPRPSTSAPLLTPCPHLWGVDKNLVRVGPVREDVQQIRLRNEVVPGKLPSPSVQEVGEALFAQLQLLLDRLQLLQVSFRVAAVANALFLPQLLHTDEEGVCDGGRGQRETDGATRPSIMLVGCL